MMQLTRYTDYSLRVLMFLGAKRNDELTTIQEISQVFGISKNHLMKITYDLSKKGYIESVRGRGGGIRLALQPCDINIGTLVRQTEDNLHLVECFDITKNMCAISSVCRLKGILNEALNAYFKVLDSFTLEQLLSNKQQLAGKLFSNK